MGAGPGADRSFKQIKPNKQVHLYKPLLFCGLNLIVPALQAQVDPGFIPPMDLPISVAGNFMELRGNHFHSGLDMKTDGRIGLPVKAVAAGWVSRIKISPWGYGKAIYVDHPGGYTTVYGHLNHFNAALGAVLLDAQYAEKSFSLDKTYSKGELPVRQGEVIAYSGNTGGSSGPHLHFEVRRTADQHALDPQAFGMAVADRVPPDLSGLRLYPLDDSARCNPYPAGALGFPVVAINDSTYQLKAGTKLSAYGTVGLAVNVIDRYSNGQNRCGVRKLELTVDHVPVFSVHLDEVDFAEQRYVNAYADYAANTHNGMKYNRLYKLPNNRLQIYGKEAAQGRMQLVPGQDHQVQITATDAVGNRSTLRFVLHGADAAMAATWPSGERPGQLFRWNNSNLLVQKGVRFSLPAKGLYEDSRIGYALLPSPSKALAPLHRIGDEETPLHLAGEISISLQDSISNTLTTKLLIVRMVKGKPVAEGGQFAHGAVTASVKNLGEFTVMLDTTPPTLVNLDLKATMTGRKGFRLKVGDDLSGLEDWTATLDGKWILLDYDPTPGILEHQFDKYSSGAGKHELIVTATDKKGNRSQLRWSYNR